MYRHGTAEGSYGSNNGSNNGCSSALYCQVIQIFLMCDDSARHQYGGSIYSDLCPTILDAHSSQNFFFKPDDARQFVEMCKHLKTKRRHRLQVHVDLGLASG